jgi:hypothetical protein
VDLLPLTEPAAGALREIRCLRANVTQAEALAALERRGGLLRGRLRQMLDLYQFSAAPTEAELQTVTTRNAPTARLDGQLAQQLLENKVRRAIFQTGFFGVRGLEIRTQSLDCEFHVPYWLGFFGHGERAALQAMDAVRRSFEGAKARAVFSDWLTQ